MRIPQKNGSDCGIAAVAMVTRNSYAKVRKTCTGGSRGGLTVHEIHWLANQFGSFRITKPRNTTLRNWTRKHKNGVVIVGDGLFSTCHAIAVVDGVVLDPGTENCQYLDSPVNMAIVPE